MEPRSDGPNQGKPDDGNLSLRPRSALMLLERPGCAEIADRLVAPPLAKWRFQVTSTRGAHDARATLMSFLRRHADADADLFTAEMILGELLTNAVEHAPGLIDVHIDWTAAQPLISVRDRGHGFDASCEGLPKDIYDESGRGLFLIATLALDVRFGPAPRGNGTQITANLPIARSRCPGTHSRKTRAA